MRNGKEKKNQLCLRIFRKNEKDFRAFIIILDTLHRLDISDPEISIDLNKIREAEWDILLKRVCEEYHNTKLSPQYYFVRGQDRGLRAAIFYGLYFELNEALRLIKRDIELIREKNDDMDMDIGDMTEDTFIEFNKDYFIYYILYGGGLNTLSKKWGQKSDPVCLGQEDLGDASRYFMGIREKFIRIETEMITGFKIKRANTVEWDTLLERKCSQYGIDWYKPRLEVLLFE